MNSPLGKLGQHADREAAYHEVHARPFPMVEAPMQISFLGLLSDPAQVASQRRHLHGLAAKFEREGPEGEADCYYRSFPGFDIRWERHQEFTTFAILRPGKAGEGFDEPAFAALPEDWVAGLAGSVVVAFHGLMLEGDSPLPGNPELARMFEGRTLFGSRIVDGRAAVWTGFRLYQDGFARFVIYNTGLSRFQAGRTLQRMMEVETYRVMALLGLPLARRIAPRVAEMDQELAAIMERISGIEDVIDEKGLLGELSELAARVETQLANAKYRFSATQAYYDIVRKRLEDLREEKFSGVSTLAKFLERRLTPAARTCAAVEEQLNDLSKRISRASDLLRTSVYLSIEEQNQQLLQSMDRRSGLQLRLQQTVEGLSVVVISYYTVGLIRVLLAAGKSAGLALNVDVISGVVVVPVVAAVWLLVRRVKKFVTD